MATLLEHTHESALGWASSVVSDGTIARVTPGLFSSVGKAQIAITSGSTAARYVADTWTALSTQTDLYLRWAWDVGTWAMTNGDTHNVLNLYDAGDVRRAHLRMTWGTTPKFQIRCTLRNDAGTESNGSYYTLGATFPPYMQLHVHKAANGTGANDAFMKLYAETTEVASITGVDLFDNFTFKELWFGHCELVDAGVTGTFTFDEFKVTDAGGLIGEPVTAVPPVNTVPVDTLGIFMTSESATQLSSVSPMTAISVVDTFGLTTCRLWCTSGNLTVTLSGSVVISAGENGTSDLTLGSGASTAEFNTVLATLTYQGDADFHGADTINVVSTGTGGSDTDTFNVINDARSLLLTASVANFASLVTATATTQMRMDEGRQSATCTVTATDNASSTDVQVITLQVAPVETVFPVRNLAVPTARRDRR